LGKKIFHMNGDSMVKGKRMPREEVGVFLVTFLLFLTFGCFLLRCEPGGTTFGKPVNLGIISLLAFSWGLVAMFFYHVESKRQKAGLTPEFNKNNFLYKSILNQVSSAVITVEAGGKVTLVNRMAEDLLGINQEQALGKHIGDICCSKIAFYKNISPFSFVSDTLNRGISYADIQVEGYQEGNKCVLQLSTKVLYDQSHHPEEVLLVVNDLTSVKMLEEQVQRNECLSVVGQMAAGIAHEIRNPLQSIKSFVQLLEQKGPGGLEVFDCAGIVMSEIDRMNLIIKEFLQLTRPAGEGFVKQDLNVIIREVVLFMQSESVLRNVVIEPQYGEGLPLIMVDKAQIKQVLINLLANAFAAMPQGGTVGLKTWYDYYLNEARIEVSDTGVGMDEETLSRIGRPFFTTKDNGTGLGLAVCYRIIKNHGGQIEVTSLIGKGSVFTIVLPGLAGLGEVLAGF